MSGTITDPAGAVIPNATVVVTNIARGFKSKVTVDGSGFYTVPNLLAGDYSITITATGFRTQTQKSIRLTVGAEQVLNFQMSVGSVAEQVEVTDEAPRVDLASSSSSALVNSTTVRELPLNGRSWTDLATLQPGVVAITSQFGFGPKVERGNRGFGDQITVNGSRPQQNNYRLDGISINDATNGGPGSVLGGNLGVDAIQEFSVITNNQSAEYGRTSGGVINAITRSGTNQFHGSAYEFIRNSALDARNYFDGPTIPTFRRNQFGAGAGGPIRRNRMFIFGDYEGIRQSKGTSFLNVVPTAAARAGHLCSAPDALSSCTPTTVTVDPSAQKYLPFWPSPNRGTVPGSGGDFGYQSYAGQQVVNENFFTIRSDVKISDKDSIYGTYMYDVAPYTAPDSLAAKLFENETWRQAMIVEETHQVTPFLINSARFGYNHSKVLNVGTPIAINPLAKDPTLASEPGNYAANVQISGGITSFGGGITKHPSDTRWASFQGYDDAFWSHGTHSVRFGVAVEEMLNSSDTSFAFDGEFFFGSFQKFLQNKPSRYLGHITPAGTSADTTQTGESHQTLYGFYAQDDWHVRPNLTLNMGLRYEITANPTRVQGSFANLAHMTDTTERLGSPFATNPTLHDFEPRLGFAWDPFNTGKTAVHGSYGIFDVLPLAYLYSNSRTTYPVVQNGNVSDSAATPLSGTFYAGTSPLLQAKSGKPHATYNDARRAYLMQYSFDIQHELLPNLTVRIGYAGSHGTHMPVRVDDADTVIPILTSAGYVFPTTATKLNTAYSGITALLYQGVLRSNSLQVNVVKSMKHGLQLQGSYTWGKAFDRGSGSLAGDQFANGIASLPAYNLASEQSLADYSVGRVFVINGLWKVPSATWAGPAGWVTNGWGLGAIAKLSDGVPFTATWGTGGDPSGLQNSDDWAYPNRLTGSGCHSAVNPGNPNHYIKTQCFAVPTAPSQAFYNQYCDPSQAYPECFNLRGNSRRNSLIGPGTENFDVTLTKDNYIKRISETFDVQFRSEFFNVLNHANFSLPVTPDNTDMFDSSGTPSSGAGLLTSTTTDSREIQFAVKVLW